MKALITDHGFASIEQEQAILGRAGAQVVVAQCKTAEQVCAVVAADADALLVQWAPITRQVIDTLNKCKVIVRYGIGVDNVDLQAARAKGIAVCNVPDYCLDEVADHALSLALALARQLPQVNARVRAGTWKMTPVTPLLAFREMTFATAGFGRIARAVLERARPFKFSLAAYDPFVADEALRAPGVTRLSLDQLFRTADILTLHSPLTPETKHLVNAARLATMKPTAIIVNTARGGLIDTLAVVEALQAGKIAAVGLDVFESEPLPADHPLRSCDTALLTSHIAWYSEASVPRLQRMAAEELVRGLRGEPLRNQVNPF